jgi:hypothetical protein
MADTLALHELDDTAWPLRRAFDEASGFVRLIALVSPT